MRRRKNGRRAPPEDAPADTASELAAALAANGAKVAVLDLNAEAAEKVAEQLRELGATVCTLDGRGPLAGFEP